MIIHIVKHAALLIVFCFSQVHAESGDFDRGAMLYRQCAPCHSFFSTENQAGPSLKGVLGRQAGTLEGYDYSEALKASGIIWNEDNIKAWISDPLTFIPRSRKRGHTLYEPELLDDLMAYLKVAQAR